MAAIARESNRLGVRKIENGLRIGVSIAKAVPQLRSAATAVGKGLDTLDSATGSAKKLGNTGGGWWRRVRHTPKHPLNLEVFRFLFRCRCQPLRSTTCECFAGFTGVECNETRTETAL